MVKTADFCIFRCPKTHPRGPKIFEKKNFFFHLKIALSKKKFFFFEKKNGKDKGKNGRKGKNGKFEHPPYVFLHFSVPVNFLRPFF